jgi:membrane-bound serine protease (ClpP class)
MIRLFDKPCFMKRLCLYLAICFLPLFAKAQKVVSIKIDGTINPASAGFIKNAIEKATSDKAECLIIYLNTPGGLLKSTRVIVSDILNASIPVVVYVAPGGAHAGSAGVFITLASHIAVMAPSTNIGAAHPVSMQGGMDSTMNDKATNDAAAFIRTIAKKRNRNFEWADEAVRNSVSITEAEALEKKVIDLVAKDEQDLLRQIHGRNIALETGSKTLQTISAKVDQVEMSFAERLLDMISDPNVAYILMMLGFYGLLFELYSPGSIAPGVLGVICLILAFYAMHTLPLNYAGLALIVVAIILFILEVKITSHGILGIGGIVALALGSIMLIKTSSALEFIRISLNVIILTTVVSTLFFAFLISMAMKAQKLKPVTGVEGMIGEEGEALHNLDPSGMVSVHGELWNARADAGRIERGQKITVTAIDNLTLHVRASGNST